MKDFNLAYKNLQKSANDLKGLHFQQSGNVESNQTTSQFAANLIKSVYDRYSADWEQFKQDLILDAKQRGYNVQQVLDNFIEPDLPEETIRIGLSGEWVSYDG
ncbi:MAG: hypothetical protein J0M23_05070 [Rickettsiales bacterium]|nr:hypothetical protein [Rickettsiales bacterium]